MTENLSRNDRPVAKERIERFAGIVNRSAIEAVSLHEFYWLVQHRLDESDLPKSYVTFGQNRQFIAQMWARYKQESSCLDAYVMRIIEAKINEPGSV